MKQVVIVDIDGTVSKVGDRLKYLKSTPKDWDAFYDACFEDEPIQEIVDLVKVLQDTYRIVFCTGRRESTREVTEKWLEKYGINSTLLMRKNNDFRHDVLAKPELVADALIPYENIAFVLEDRNSMVEMWRSVDVKCLQVAPGNF